MNKVLKLQFYLRLIRSDIIKNATIRNDRHIAVKMIAIDPKSL